MPKGVVDPTPFLYDTALYSLGGVMCVAAIAHKLIKPIDPKYYEKIHLDNCVENEKKKDEEIK